MFRVRLHESYRLPSLALAVSILSLSATVATHRFVGAEISAGKAVGVECWRDPSTPDGRTCAVVADVSAER
jgi:hypothetical protein